MNVLIDSNIILNILLKQPDYYEGSSKMLTLVEIGQITGFVSTSAITDIFYISKKSLGKDVSREGIKHMLHFFQPATVTGNHIYKALDMEWKDFEDSVQYVVGESLSVDYIISRNKKDFTSGSIPTVTPEQFIEAITDNT